MAAGDLFWNDVYVATHMENAAIGTNAKGPNFISDGAVLPARSSAQFQFGAYSALFNGVDTQLVWTDAIGSDRTNDSAQSLQLWCRPITQVQLNPCVLSWRHVKIEYKPEGYPYGFAITVDGTKRSCGVHPEDNWYFLYFTQIDNEIAFYINGQLIFSATASYWWGNKEMSLGSAGFYSYPGTGFAGYIDDVLITGRPSSPIYEPDTPPGGGFVRITPQTPTAAFLERLPDPVGEVLDAFLWITGAAEGTFPTAGMASGSLLLSGAGVGYMAPKGDALGSLKFSITSIGSIPCAAKASGSLTFTGLSEGYFVSVAQASGSLTFGGAAVGQVGGGGGASGSLRYLGVGSCTHGVSGVGSCRLSFTGVSLGSTTFVPVGKVSGPLRFTGYSVGTGGVDRMDYCD